MSGGLRELYQEIILDHSRSPRNAGPVADATGEARGNNPLCGDRVTVQVRLDGDRVAAVGFEARGCAISVASASMMTTALEGKTAAEARAALDDFVARVTGGEDEDPGDLGELSALMGVRAYPTRVKCATLPWHAFAAALEGGGEGEVTTEQGS